MLKRRRNARCTAVAVSVLKNSRTQKILRCIVSVLFSTDAAARSCARRALQRWCSKIQDLLFQIHISYTVREIQMYEIDSIVLNHALQLQSFFQVGSGCSEDQRLVAATLLRLTEPVPILQKAGGWLDLGAGLDEQLISRPSPEFESQPPSMYRVATPVYRLRLFPRLPQMCHFKETGRQNGYRFVAMLLANYSSKSCTSQSCSSVTQI